MARLDIVCKRCGREDFGVDGPGYAALLTCDGCGDALELVPMEQRSRGQVYFIGGEEGPIKIGMTRRPVRERLREIQTGHHSELFVWACVSGDEKIEAALHKLLKNSAMHGEWFERTPEVFSVLLALRGLAAAIVKPADPPEPDPTKPPQNADFGPMDGVVVKFRALTPAEKQRAYRERQKKVPTS